MPDEAFVEQFRIRLANEFGSQKRKGHRLYAIRMQRQLIATLRTLLNDRIYPKGLLQRPLLGTKAYQKYRPLLELTPKSLEAIVWFEENGKCVRSERFYLQEDGELRLKVRYRWIEQPLLPRVIDERIRIALTLLKRTSRRGFESVVPEDIETFLSPSTGQGMARSKGNQLAEVATFFANLQLKGFIPSNPFECRPVKRAKAEVRREFVSQQGIQQLRDLTSLDHKNPLEVRDRLACLLLYDLALRRMELLLLECCDISPEPDGGFRIRLRPECQKGNRTMTEVMYLFFPETKQLLKTYLSRVRTQLHPQCAKLFLTARGNPISSERFCEIIKQHCQKLLVRTFDGNVPTPHAFRHAFATLNIQPLGLGLPLQGIIERLRHTDYKIATKHYIHNNPYLRKLKHIAYEQQGQIEKPWWERISVEEFVEWLQTKLGLGQAWIDQFQRRFIQYQNERNRRIEIENKPINRIPEREVIHRFSKQTHFGLGHKALRPYCLRNGLCEGRENNGRKEYWYHADFIDELVTQWVPKEMIIKKLKLPRRTFYHELKRRNWRSIKIGQRLLVKRSDIV